MTNALEQRGQLPAGVTIGETGLQLAKGLDFEALDKTARILAGEEQRREIAHGSILWAVGDLLDAAPDEDIALQLASRFSPGTARNALWVCRHVKDRRPALTFGHHQAVASLPADVQSELLDMAEELHWTRSELREEVARFHRKITPGVIRVNNRLSYSLSYALAIKELVGKLEPAERERLAAQIKKIARVYESLL